MKFAFTEDQETLRAAARAFLADNSSSAQVRQVMETGLGYDPEVWRRIGGELGWTSVIVPEAYGGAGLTYVDLVALMEELGGALLCAPFLSTICLAANALLVGGNETQKQEHLPGIACGETVATLAHSERNGRWDAAAIEARARREGAEYVLDGVKSFVLDGHSAALLIVAARREGSRGASY